jgi:LysM repeat protein
MLRNFFPLIFSLCMATTMTAQTIYLKMDESCMDRLEYTSANASSTYVSYGVKVGDMQFANFDVGIESSEFVKDLPAKVIYCNALKIDGDFVKLVNDGTLQLYIVRETPTNYHIGEVDKASFLSTKGGTMEFFTDDATFALNLINPIAGVNLALPGSKAAVYLDGMITYQCLKGFIIQKKENADSRTFKEYVMIPEIGIVARASVAKTGFVSDPLRDNEFNLAKVDGIAFKSVLSEICDRVQASYYDVNKAKGTSQPSSTDVIASKGGEGIPASYGGGDPCAPTTEPGIHVVQKGETLYGISKRYGVQVAQLQSWNTLANTNLINVCQRLKVKELAATNTTAGTQTTEKGGSTTATTAGFWNTSAGEHQVRYGETVASLARMYGFTEERFRKMNGLSATEILLPGQRLRTNDCNCPTLQSTTAGTPPPYDQPTETLTSKDGSATATASINNNDVYYRPISVHVVKSTDTFFTIAKEYNTTIERIWELNGMTKNDKLVTDQRIYVQ